MARKSCNEFFTHITRGEIALIVTVFLLIMVFPVFLPLTISSAVFYMAKDELNCCHDMQCCVINTTVVSCMLQDHYSPSQGFQPTWYVQLTQPGYDACAATGDQIVVSDIASGNCKATEQKAVSALDAHRVMDHTELCYLCECDRYYITSNVQWSLQEPEKSLVATKIFGFLAILVLAVAFSFCICTCFPWRLRVSLPLGTDALPHYQAIHDPTADA
jgi:hypothetical protein